jgi:[ribosomal protein S18]-alanine N-acetyltransferase
MIREGAVYPHVEDRAWSHPSVYNGGVEFTLRDFQAADFDILWSIDQRCFVPGIAYSRRELGTYIGHPKSFTLLAEAIARDGQEPPAEGMKPEDRGIVGFLVAESGRRVGHIITIDVLPVARRAGVGSKLLSAAEERLSAVSCRSVYLETAADNASALAFYKRHQYFLVKTVPGYYSNGVDALVLQKELLSQARAG